MSEWRAVVGYEGRYEVSDGGLVMSKERYVDFRGGKLRVKERVLKAMEAKGYLRVNLHGPNGERKGWLVHRLVATAFVENPNSNPCTDHVNGKKMDNRAVNLEWVTVQENNLRAWAMGLCKATPARKLSEEVVREIRSKYHWEKEREVAKEFGIGRGYLRGIVGRKIYGEVAEDGVVVPGEYEVAGERWKRITGYEEYEVSDQGRVRDVLFRKMRKRLVVHKKYRGVFLGTLKMVNRLVAEAFVPCKLEGGKMDVVTKNFDGDDLRAENLMWVTRREAVRRAEEKSPKRKADGSRAARGEACGNAKLNADQARAIVSRYGSGNGRDEHLVRTMAKEYGISRETIYGILSGRSWKHAIKRLDGVGGGG